MSSPPRRVPKDRARRALARYFLLGGLLLFVVAASLGGARPPLRAGVTGFASGGIPPGGSSSVVNVTVNMTDTPGFHPNSVVAPAGGVVGLKVSNQGAYNHTLTVSAVPNYVLPRTLTPAQLDAFFSANGTLANLFVLPGQSQFFNLTVPSVSGGTSYEFVSTVPYQFQSGMLGFLNVSGGPSGPGVVVTEQATDQLRFLPDQLGVNATTFPAVVDVQVTNVGGTPHTWTLAPQSNVSLTPGNFTAYFGQHPPLASVSLANAGDVRWANFSVPAPGVYEYICEIPGHFNAGMSGELYVGVPLPASTSGPSTAIVQEGVLIGAGSLLGIGVIFAAAGSFVGRMPRRPREGQP